jgi:hypothetical protein
MQLSVALGFVATSAAALAAPAPVPAAAIAMGSKHNLYLTTCTSKCVLGILCSRQQRSHTAVLYYANGPVDSSRNTSPTQMTTVTDPAAPWEGTQRAARLGRTGDFTSNIDEGADSISSGQIAGGAKLATEDFVCFRDGETTFKFSEDLGLSSYSCTADYWCPSIQV